MRWSCSTLLVAYILPQMRCIKVVIDGTIDFGPNWNFEYTIIPANRFEEQTVPAIRNILRNSAFDARANDDSADVLRDNSESRENAGIVADYSSDGKIDENKVYDVTQMFPPATKPNPLFGRPRRIGDDTQVVKFLDHIKNETLNMFNDVSDNLESTYKSKINELKQRYIEKFEEFENSTKNQTIKTIIGSKNVILNAIDFSNELLNRLVNRFKIDTEDASKGGVEAAKLFQLKKDDLRQLADEDACRRFSICRTGDELSDRISELITTLLEHNDTKVSAAAKAATKALKSADFSKIMDPATQQAFKRALDRIEELNPFELRIVLITYKVLIDRRHQPFLNDENQNQWILPTVAVFHVIEGINKNVIIASKEWREISGDYKKWLAGEDADVAAVAQKLVNRIQSGVEKLDRKTAKDFKEKLKMSVNTNAMRVSATNYLQFQPFII